VPASEITHSIFISKEQIISSA